jgi:hypothetical protein
MQGNGDSKGSRRKRVAKEGQRLPLFMSAGRSRVTESVAMSAATAREKQRYLKWAAEAAGVSREEAEVMMLDRAIGDYMKKDEGWLMEKADRGSAEESDSGPEAAAAASAAGASNGKGGTAPATPPRPDYLGELPPKQSNGAAATVK